MSNVRYTYPKLRLSAQLKEAGGLTVADAVEAADANLAELAPPCLTELRSVTSEALAAFRAFPAQFDRGALEGLYAIAARAVGLGAVSGAPSADVAFKSLCDLVDHFCGAGRWDLKAVAVHIDTLQLLVLSGERPMEAALAERLLEGLTKVSARYAPGRAPRAAVG
jgi:hypothetical protein